MVRGGLGRAGAAWLRVSCVSMLTLVGCADASPGASHEAHETQEAESRSFRRDLVLLDEALADHDAMTEAEIQALLEETPYGNRSVLADHVSGGMTAAKAIADAAATYRINPVAILTRAQMEQSLLGRTTASTYRLNHAMGCGCPDGGGCSSQYRGFHKQAECMASLMRQYLDDQADGGTTVAGWSVGRGKRTLDGYTVVPLTRATAALYTYTPWVVSNRSHAEVWSRIARHLSYEPPAAGGCPAVSFASGITLQLRPGPSDACVVVPEVLYDPVAHVVHPASVKLADNFRLSEFAAASDDNWLMLEPALVSTLQAIRDDLAQSVSIVDGFRTPEAHDASCPPELCEAKGLTTGEGVVIRSGAIPSAVLDAAASAGATACWPLGDGDVYIGTEADGAGCE